MVLSTSVIFSLMWMYLLLMLYGLSSSSLLLIWILMEFMLVVVLVYMSFSLASMTNLFEYFLVQAVSSLLMVLGMWCSWGLLVMVGVVVKMGMVPASVWVYNMILGNDSLFVMWVVLTLQKALPLYLLSCYGYLIVSINNLMYLLVGLTSFVGAVLINFSGSFKWLMVSSSMMHTSWLIALCIISYNYYIIYFLSYTVFMGLIIIGSKYNYLEGYNSFLIFISGVPPMVGFMYKMYMMSGVYMLVWPLVLIMFLSSVVSVVGYMFGVMGSSMYILHSPNLLLGKGLGYTSTMSFTLLVITSLIFFMVV